MSANTEACLVSAQVKSADGRTVDVCGAMRSAVEDSGYRHNAAAVDTGYQPDYWTRVLAGERGIILDRLGALPRNVQISFLAAWAAQLGIRIERRDRVAPDLAELITSRRVRITLEPLEP
jgi:hypothetical protein